MNTYHKGLDGLRAYSVILVMLFHARLLWWGWVGVQVFFILSGFLIAGILIKAKESSDYYRIFYIRRILRIFPLYYLLLLIAIISAFAFNSTYRDSLLYVLYLQNYKLGFSNFNANFPYAFGHTWSLAVEEQFYLVFPFIVRISPKPALKWILGFLILLGILEIFILPHLYPGTAINWVNTVSNFLFLGSGAFLATLKIENIRIAKIILLLVSVIAIISYAVSFNIKPVDLTKLPGQFFLVAITPIILLLTLHLISQKSQWTDFLFKNKAVVYIGKISYGIYLFHYPVFVFADKYNQSVLFKFSITFLLAIISWHFFESKFLALKDRFTYKKPSLA